MAFRPPRKVPQFADLKAVLAQSKDVDESLYQVIQEIIERLATIQFDTLITLGDGTGTGGGGGTGAETFLTKLNELATLPNSSRLIARNSITFDDSVAGVRDIDLDLEYSGDYVAGPTYVDGDIIVGPDQVAYICVRPTNSPPVPWPGIGIISSEGPQGPPGPQGPQGIQGPPGTGAVVDAKYWVVEPHPDLANERALSLLTNGYVKSTAGEPSTIQIIPVSEGGTGASTPLGARTNLGLATVAYKDQDNTFIGQNTFAGYTVFTNPGQFSPTIVTAAPIINFYETDQGADHHYKRLLIDGDTFFFQSVNDAYTTPATWASISAFGMVLGPTGLNPIFADGVGLINLNATQLTTGTVPLPRLGTNAPAVGQFLAWDNTWKIPPSAFPSGLIVLNDGPCPVGWTRVNFDGRFLRVNSSAGSTGGSATHQHGAGTLSGNPHSHGGSVSVTIAINGTTGSNGSHTHSFAFHVGGTTGPGGGPSGTVQTADAGTSFQTLIPSHTHNFGADIGGNTDPVGDHTHSFNGSGSGSGTIPSEGVGISGQTDAQSNLPPYIDIILCRKD